MDVQNYWVNCLAEMTLGDLVMSLNRLRTCVE